MKRFKSIHIILFVLLSNISFAQNRSEYTIKAVLISKITKFVEWPDSKVEKNKFIISIIGDNPFLDILDNIYSYQTINGKNVEIRYIKSINEIKNTDLLYIAKSEKDEIDKILKYTRSRSILTLGESRGFAEKGVHINFLIKNNKVRFEINETAIRESDFYVSFRLLNQAIIVNPLNE